MIQSRVPRAIHTATIMDKYKVIGLLGEGSFGRVYKAKKNSDGNFVAFKVISKVSNS